MIDCYVNLVSVSGCRTKNIKYARNDVNAYEKNLKHLAREKRIAAKKDTVCKKIRR